MVERIRRIRSHVHDEMIRELVFHDRFERSDRLGFFHVASLFRCLKNLRAFFTEIAHIRLEAVTGDENSSFSTEQFRILFA